MDHKLSSMEIDVNDVNDLFEKFYELFDTEYFEAIKNVSGLVTKMKAVSNFYMNMKYAAFIKGLSRGSDAQQTAKTLSELIERKSFRLYLMSELQSIGTSNSVLCCFLRGLLLAEYKTKDKLSSKEQYLLMNLQNVIDQLTDIDIEVLVKYVSVNGDEFDSQKVVDFSVNNFRSWCEENNYDKSLFDLSYSKLKNNSFFEEYTEYGQNLHRNTFEEEYGMVSETIEGIIDSQTVVFHTDLSELFFKVIQDNINELSRLSEKLKSVV